MGNVFEVFKFGTPVVSHPIVQQQNVAFLLTKCNVQSSVISKAFQIVKRLQLKRRKRRDVIRCVGTVNQHSQKIGSKVVSEKFAEP